MFNSLKLLFNIKWLKNAINKITLGIASTKIVINYINTVLKGTPQGDKVIPYLNNILELLATFENTLNVINKILGCESVEAILQRHNITVIDANKNIQKITKELHEINL